MFLSAPRLPRSRKGISGIASFCAAVCFLLKVINSVHALDGEGANNNNNKSPHSSSAHCIVGAGPGGLQVALELEALKLDWVLFERAPRAGSFFKKLPRFGRLISINKRAMPESAPGGVDGTFAMRHDWNSLLVRSSSKEEEEVGAGPRPQNSTARFTSFSDEYYPSARRLATYLANLAETELPPERIHFNTSVSFVRRWEDCQGDGDVGGGQRWCPFELELKLGDAEGEAAPTSSLSSAIRWQCDRLIWATNFGTPNDGGGSLVGNGWKHAIPYDEAPEDLDFYRNKAVLVVGGGNAAYEVARATAGVASRVAVWTRRAPRMAWQSHYPGDVRGWNTQLFDQYQLKTLDALLVSLSPKSAVHLETVVPCGEEEEGDDDVGTYIEVMQNELAKLARKGSREAVRAAQSLSEELEALNLPCTAGNGTLPPRFEVSEEPDKAEESDGERVLRQFQAEHDDGKTESHHIEGFDVHARSDRYARAFDIVIRALGWKFDPSSVFDESVRPLLSQVPRNKFPALERQGYGSINVPGLYFAGSLAHEHDWRRSSGGFIHGFRYSARALVRAIGEDYESGGGKGWPAALRGEADLLTSVEAQDALTAALLRRAQEGDGIYQMFSELCIYVSLRRDAHGAVHFTVYDEVPVRRVLDGGTIGREYSDTFLTLTFEYGRDFHGERVLLAQGATDEFIQPTLRLYNRLPGMNREFEGHSSVDDDSQCSSHKFCSSAPCLGRCSRFYRRCVCNDEAKPLSDTNHYHWRPHTPPRAPGDTSTEPAAASRHPLDEFSDVMPDLTVSVGESVDTEWVSLKHRLRIECFVQAVVGLLKGERAQDISLALAKKGQSCPGAILRESRAYMSSSERNEAELGLHPGHKRGGAHGKVTSFDLRKPRKEKNEL